MGGRKPWQDVKQVETAPPDRQQLHACAGCNVTGKGQKETTQREIGNRRPGVGVWPRDQRENHRHVGWEEESGVWRKTWGLDSVCMSAA